MGGGRLLLRRLVLWGGDRVEPLEALTDGSVFLWCAGQRLGLLQVLQAVVDGVVDIRVIAVLFQEPGHGMAQGCRCLDKEDLAHGAGSWLRRLHAQNASHH